MPILLFLCCAMTLIPSSEAVTEMLSSSEFK